jgi:hypothetical protein
MKSNTDFLRSTSDKDEPDINCNINETFDEDSEHLDQEEPYDKL